MVRKSTWLLALILCCSFLQSQERGSELVFRLVSSNNPSSYGDRVEFAAEFPEETSGTVTFKSGSEILGKKEVVSGQAIFVTSDLTIGTHQIQAVYEGPIGRGSAALTQTVHQASPTVVLNCTPNFSIYGEPIECEAAVPSDATGTVTFIDGEVIVGKSEPADGSAIYTLRSLPTGSHLLTARYSGDRNYHPAHGRQVQTITQADSWVKISCSPASVWLGESVSCLAEAPPDATGYISFSDGGMLVRQVKLVEGSASFNTPNLGVGSHYIRAGYSGDSNYRGSGAACAVTVVDPSEYVQQ